MAALTNAVILRAASLCRDVYAHERDYIVDNSIPGFTIIAVEGTSSAGDWLTNIKFLFRNDDTHRGFKENAMRLVNQLFVREQIDFKTQLVVCGHSLGGATATVLADMLRQGAGLGFNSGHFGFQSFDANLCLLESFDCHPVHLLLFDPKAFFLGRRVFGSFLCLLENGDHFGAALRHLLSDHAKVQVRVIGLVLVAVVDDLPIP
jgi:pimeloyl-ACP methyl ester carboxylesterase